ncbi:MAG: VPLPA-CTERM sorting domain-containing protein [Pseudomonadota bacterium]
MSIRKALLAAALTCAATSATAIPVQWTEASGGNGHWYDVIYTGERITQGEAIIDAEARSYLGLDGYLATITSAEEMAFINANLDRSRIPYISGTDAAVEGTWVFNSGPEAGTVMSYFNWNPGEPNNSGGREDILHTWSNGLWNDHITGDIIDSYIIEYSQVAPVPLPASAAMLIVAVAGLGVARRRKG